MLADSSIPGQHRLRGLQGLQMPQDLQKMHRLLGSLSEVGGPVHACQWPKGRVPSHSDTTACFNMETPLRFWGDFLPPGLVATAAACRAQRWPGQETIQGGRGWQRCDGWRDCSGARCRASYQDGMDQSLRLLLNSKTQAGHQPDWITSKYHLPTPFYSTGWPQHTTTTVSFEQLGIPLGHGSHHDSSLPGSNAQRRGCWGCRGRCSCYSQPGGERLEPSREPWWHWEAWRKIWGKVSMYMYKVYILYIHIGIQQNNWITV